eukprot:3669268-Amphidinium_carterae.1
MSPESSLRLNIVILAVKARQHAPAELEWEGQALATTMPQALQNGKNGKVIKAGAILALTWSSSIVGWAPTITPSAEYSSQANALGYLLARSEAMERNVSRRHH